MRSKVFNTTFENMLRLLLLADTLNAPANVDMVDTPLLGFDENEDEFGDNTIKNGLYQYFINHQGNGQVIIVDNLNVIPEDIDFKAKGINVVTYHKDEKDGHIYGFMPSWRKDLPKESL